MEQRTYRGNVDPQDLAQHLVATFGQGFNTVAQQVGHGDQIMVQIGHASHSGRRVRNVIGVSISRTGDGLTVGIGQSRWIDVADSTLTPALIGAIFFPPLLIFPLLRGVRQFALYEDLWNAIDAYCTRAGATQVQTESTPGLYCPRCGVLNHEENRFCTACGMDLQTAPAPPPPSATAATVQVTCPECHQIVSAGKFCGNCGTRLVPPTPAG